MRQTDFRYRGPDTLEVLFPPNPAVYLGGVLLFFGAFGTLTEFLQRLDSRGTPPLFLLAVTAGLSAGGTLCLCGMRGLSFDRRREELRRWHGLWLPFGLSLRFGVKPRSFKEFIRVEFRRETRTYQSSRGTSSRTVYPLSLIRSGSERERLAELHDVDQARSRAERVAKFMGLGVTNSAADPPLEREAGSLDEPLRARLRREGRGLHRPERPPIARTRMDHEPDATVFALPARRISSQAAPALALLPVGAAVLYWPGGDFLPFRVLAGVVVGVGVLGVLVWLWLQESVRVSPEGLEVRRRWLFLQSDGFIPASELEEIGLCNDGLAAWSDRARLLFGANLPREEQEWMRDEILHRISQ